MNFISKGSQLSVLQLKGWFKFKLSMWRIKNQSSNATSCRDNALHLLALVTTVLYWILSKWRCVRFQWARSHLHSAGPRPSHASFIARSSCPHMHGNSSSLGTDVTILSQNYKYSSWHYFQCSQVNWWSSLTYQRSLVAYVTVHCHIGSQQGKYPIQVRTRRPESEGGVGGAGPNQVKMWSSPGQNNIYIYIYIYISFMGWKWCANCFPQHDDIRPFSWRVLFIERYVRWGNDATYLYI
jgi:hypothetical protein